MHLPLSICSIMPVVRPTKSHNCPKAIFSITHAHCTGEGGDKWNHIADVYCCWVKLHIKRNHPLKLWQTPLIYSQKLLPHLKWNFQIIWSKTKTYIEPEMLLVRVIQEGKDLGLTIIMKWSPLGSFQSILGHFCIKFSTTKTFETPFTSQPQHELDLNFQY